LIIDASALVAIILREPEADAFLEILELKRGRAKTHPISVWEASRGLARAGKMTIPEAQEKVSRFISIFRIEVVTIEPEDALKALGAAEHYGIGTGNPAKLNLGDCFTYAIAMRYDEPILFKGNDFTHTRIGQENPPPSTRR
jgi:ribonuclease VapC